MEQRKIEHITLHLIVFGTISIIGVLARQTVLHYGWDEFSSYLILVVCWKSHATLPLLAKQDCPLWLQYD